MFNIHELHFVDNPVEQYYHHIVPSSPFLSKNVQQHHYPYTGALLLT